MEKRKWQLRQRRERELREKARSEAIGGGGGLLPLLEPYRPTDGERRVLKDIEAQIGQRLGVTPGALSAPIAQLSSVRDKDESRLRAYEEELARRADALVADVAVADETAAVELGDGVRPLPMRRGEVVTYSLAERRMPTGGAWRLVVCWRLNSPHRGRRVFGEGAGTS